jgi:glycyl-tRNA synthetase beta chain
VPELLLEVGCEELPASQVERAFTQLRDGVLARLEEARLAHEEASAFGTPRRLVLVIVGVAERQPDSVKEQRGPKVSAAYDAEGQPTKALEGFCRSQGVALSEVRVEGEYVYVTKHVPGLPAREVLADILPDAIRAISFDKTMRWGEGRMRFARPIRWLLALLDGEVVPFDLEGVVSGNRTRGHRILAPGEFEVNGFEDYATKLRGAFVEFDPALRREKIIAGARDLWPANRGTVEADDAILDENVYLTEWPMPSLGAFDEAFLELPESVLIVAMKKHEKFLPLRDEHGKLAPNFVSIRNSGDEQTVVRGNQWVLAARFNDARFFFEEDTKESPILPRFAAKLDRIVFQEKLGSLADKTTRLVVLCRQIAEQLCLSEQESEWASRAASLAKADLASGLVMELPALQGTVGAEYAQRDGEPSVVCEAIRHHYGTEQPPINAGTRLARVLMAADRIDTLCGYLGLGMAPSGSSDPFGLRRATHLLIMNGLAWPQKQPFPDLRLMTAWAVAAYAEQGHEFSMSEVLTSLAELAIGRYELIYSNLRHDLLAAVLGSGWEDPSKVAARAALIAERAVRPGFVDYVRTATRPGNIARAATGKGIEAGTVPPISGVMSRLQSVDNTLFEHEAEAALFDAAIQTTPEAIRLVEQRDYDALYHLLHSHLASPIGAFFDSVMVMAEDVTRRDNRLRLLSALASLYFELADFSKVVIEGA